MKLYVDDLRVCPEGWTLARTNTEAIRALYWNSPVDEISIDHDICVPFSGELSAPVRKRLQIGQETFQPVVYYIMALPPELRPKKVTMHTANVAAGHMLIDLMASAGIVATYQEGSYIIDLGEDEK
jgi:hypothetical protein